VLASGLAPALAQDQRNDRGMAARNGVGAQAGQAQPDPARMNQLLKDWEKQSAKLKTLDVKLYRIDSTPAWNEEVHYEGRAVFKRPELAYLDFRKIKIARNAKGQLAPEVDPKNKQRVTAACETIICTGKEVWQYIYDVKQIFVYPLDKQQQKRALDEGPLPFLFNMRAEDAQRRYEMSLERETPKFIWVVVQPKLAQDRESFKKAWVFLDPQFLLPLRIVLFAPDGKSTKDFHLSGIQPNAAVDNRYFEGVGLRGWKVIRDPQAPGNPRANAGADPRQAGPSRR
jgi:TIGR03009 family protein